MTRRIRSIYFVKSHLEKMKLWAVENFFEHICHLFWVSATANPPKSDDKYAQKSVQLLRGSSFRSYFLQNSYFSTYIEIFSPKKQVFPRKKNTSPNFFGCASVCKSMRQKFHACTNISTNPNRALQSQLGLVVRLIEGWNSYPHSDRFLIEMFQNHGLKEWISLRIMLLWLCKVIMSHFKHEK